MNNHRYPGIDMFGFRAPFMPIDMDPVLQYFGDKLTEPALGLRASLEYLPHFGDKPACDLTLLSKKST
jgi:hypothetical protein